MPAPLLSRLAGLKRASTPELRAQWRELFESEPPKYNRRFLEDRLAYRIQELTHGRLTEATVERLQALGEQLDGGRKSRRQIRGDRELPAGLVLKRKVGDVTHTVLVTREGFEWEGQCFKSISAVAKAIAKTKWNGWTFFGLKRQKASS